MSAFMFFDVVPARLARRGSNGPCPTRSRSNEIYVNLQPLQAADVKHLYVNCYRNDFLSLITKTYALCAQLRCWSPVPVVPHIARFFVLDFPYF
jgi:hypothetical protein